VNQCIPGPFRPIHFKDSSLGWLVGDQGVIYASKDGGKSWTRQPIGSSRDQQSPGRL